jgi:hypothetical protein
MHTSTLPLPHTFPRTLFPLEHLEASGLFMTQAKAAATAFAGWQVLMGYGY